MAAYFTKDDPSRKKRIIKGIRIRRRRLFRLRMFQRVIRENLEFRLLKDTPSLHEIYDLI